MRILIDGYNLMYASGRISRNLGPDGLRKLRHRFLTEIASALDPVDAHQTTIVFDANDAPQHLSSRTRHKGLDVIFAVGEPSADEYLENLIKDHPNPRQLLVVSTDNRVRLAASKRRARVSTSDEYLTHLDSLKAKRNARQVDPVPAPQPERPTSVSAAESAYWLEQFSDLADSPELKESLSAAQLLSDEEIRKIEREVAAEQGPTSWSPSQGRRPPKKR